MNYKRELTIKENMQLVLEGKQPEWLPSFYEDCALVSHKTLGRRPIPGTNRLIDAFGTEFIVTADGPIPTPDKHRIEDITKWRDVMPQIDLDSIDWEGEAKLINGNSAKEGQLIHLHAGSGVWEQLHYMMGFENAFLALMLEEEAVCEFMSAVADFQIDALKRLFKYLNPEYVLFYEHFATVKGLLISPDMYRKILKPFHKRMYAEVVKLGAIAEFHIDGYVEDIVPDLVEIGVRAIQPFQVMNNINEDKEKYKILAIGGWDAFGPGNQEGSTEDEIRESVRVAMDTYGPGSRYVFWASGLTEQYTKHLSIIRDEAINYGRTFYDRDRNKA